MSRIALYWDPNSSKSSSSLFTL